MARGTAPQVTALNPITGETITTRFDGNELIRSLPEDQKTQSGYLQAAIAKGVDPYIAAAAYGITNPSDAQKAISVAQLQSTVGSGTTNTGTTPTLNTTQQLSTTTPTTNPSPTTVVNTPSPNPSPSPTQQAFTPVTMYNVYGSSIKAITQADLNDIQSKGFTYTSNPVEGFKPVTLYNSLGSAFVATSPVELESAKNQGFNLAEKPQLPQQQNGATTTANSGTAGSGTGGGYWYVDKYGNIKQSATKTQIPGYDYEYTDENKAKNYSTGVTTGYASKIYSKDNPADITGYVRSENRDALLANNSITKQQYDAMGAADKKAQEYATSFGKTNADYFAAPTTTPSGGTSTINGGAGNDTLNGGTPTPVSSFSTKDLEEWGKGFKGDILGSINEQNKKFGTEATAGFMDAFKNFAIPTGQKNGVNLGNYNDNRNASADQWWSQYITGRR